MQQSIFYVNYEYMKREIASCIFCGNGEIKRLKARNIVYKRIELEYIYIQPLEKFCAVCPMCNVKHLEYYKDKYPHLF